MRIKADQRAGRTVGGLDLGAAAAEHSEADEFEVIRTLARLCPDLDYPDGVINEAYSASEWLDCECHALSPERDSANVLEAALRSNPREQADPSLLAAAARAGVRGPVALSPGATADSTPASADLVVWSGDPADGLIDESPGWEAWLDLPAFAHVLERFERAYP